MEWVRSCYKSKWRLTRGADTLRDGFYWFCEPETPFYPGLHQLGSRDWTSDERVPEPLLGEYWGDRKWYRGDAPARRPLPVLVGSPDCIKNGDEPGLPIVLDRSAFCGQILPPACYSPESEILHLTNPLDCVFGKNSADIINLAYTDLPAAAAAVEAILGPTAVVSTFSQPGPFVPAGVIALIGTTAVVWLTGTTTFEQAAAQALYFGFGLVNLGLYSSSGLYEAAAFVISDQLTAASGAGATRVVLCGHSFGGAVCMVLAAKMRLANPARDVEILTLGAPAPGDERLIDLIDTMIQMHYCNERDPIPLLPPSGVEFAFLFPIIGALLALSWNAFARPPRVRMITQDGTFTTVLTDNVPDDLITIAATAIAAAQDVPIFKHHGVDWYAYYLCLGCPCVPRPCVPPDDPGVGFNLELDALAFTFLGVAGVLTIPPTDLLPTAFFPDGKPSTWQAVLPGVATATITAAQDAIGNYTSFSVFTEPDPVDPLWICEWDFTAAEILAGIDLSTFPDSFSAPNVGDGVTSLGSLVIVPTIA